MFMSQTAYLQKELVKLKADYDALKTSLLNKSTNGFKDDNFFIAMMRANIVEGYVSQSTIDRYMHKSVWNN